MSNNLSSQMEDSDQKVQKPPSESSYLSNISRKPSSSESVLLHSKPRHNIPSTYTSQTKDETAGRHRHHRHRRREHSKQYVEGRNKHYHEDIVSEELPKPKHHGLENVNPISKAQEDSTATFVEDRKGDPLNLAYGRLHRYSVPRYRAAGYGRLIGLSRGFTIRPDEENSGRLIQEQTWDSSTKSWKKGPASKTENRGTSPTLIRRDAVEDDLEVQRDYVALDSRMSRKRRRIERHDLGRALSGRAHEIDEATSEVGRDSSTSTSSDSDSEEPNSGVDIENPFEDFRENAAQKKLVELSRRLDNHPDDIEAWFAMINHQEAILGLQQDGRRKALSNAEKRGLADVKVSIYEKALSKVKAHEGRDRLIIALMQEGSKVWDTKKLASQWKSVLKENVGSLHLWVTYLDFLQTHVIAFTYEHCKSVYTDFFQMASVGHCSAKDDQMRIYVLLRMTLYMQEAGFAEHATGIWQALLEFSFSRPSDLTENEMSSFSAFWDSEVARIGEKESKGWWSTTSSEVEPRTDIPNLPVNSRRTFETWADRESAKEADTRFPARTLDDVEEDDPYRVIIFSDVKDFLFRPGTVEGKKLLLDAFLIFCNLPSVVSYNQDSQRQWAADPFLREVNLETGRIPTSSDGPLKTYAEFSAPNFATETATLFHFEGHWFDAWHGSSTSRRESIDLEWCRLALRRLVDALPENDSLAEYAVSFEFRIDPKEARKYAKNLLKTRSSSLHMYGVFGLIESRLGNSAAAERVWATALSMSQTFPKDTQQDTILLWKTWVWECLDHGQFSKALALLLATPDGEVNVQKLPEAPSSTLELNSTTILKAERHLQNHLFRAQALGYGPGIVHFTELSALLAYLSNQFSLSAALQIYDQNPESMSQTYREATSIIKELMNQSCARLLHLHAQSSTNGHRPTDISTKLADFIHAFPSNTIFLTLYHHHTQRFILTDRIRSILPVLGLSMEKAMSTQSIIPHLFSIWTELRRPSYGGSTAHSIRAAFDRAVSPEAAGKASPSLWKAFIEWETATAAAADSDAIDATTFKSAQQQQKKQFSRAIDVYYRGIRACPWAKQLYMLAFKDSRLRDAIGFDGLRTIYETMVEKELRIYVDLSDLLDKRDRRGEE